MPKAVLFEENLEVNIAIRGERGSGKTRLSHSIQSQLELLVQDHFDAGKGIDLTINDGEEGKVFRIRSVREYQTERLA